MPGDIGFSSDFGSPKGTFSESLYTQKKFRGETTFLGPGEAGGVKKGVRASFSIRNHHGRLKTGQML